MAKKKEEKASEKKGIFGHLFKGIKLEISKVEEKAGRNIIEGVEKIEEVKEKVLRIGPSTKIPQILESYDKKNITIGVLGGHSALDVCRGAKKLGFRTVAVCQ